MYKKPGNITQKTTNVVFMILTDTQHKMILFLALLGFITKIV